MSVITPRRAYHTVSREPWRLPTFTKFGKILDDHPSVVNNTVDHPVVLDTNNTPGVTSPAGRYVLFASSDDDIANDGGMTLATAGNLMGPWTWESGFVLQDTGPNFAGGCEVMYDPVAQKLVCGYHNESTGNARKIRRATSTNCVDWTIIDDWIDLPNTGEEGCELWRGDEAHFLRATPRSITEPDFFGYIATGDWNGTDKGCTWYLLRCETISSVSSDGEWYQLGHFRVDGPDIVDGLTSSATTGFFFRPGHLVRIDGTIWNFGVRYINYADKVNAQPFAVPLAEDMLTPLGRGEIPFDQGAGGSDDENGCDSLSLFHDRDAKRLYVFYCGRTAASDPNNVNVMLAYANLGE